MDRKHILNTGVAGCDFHNFNTYYCNNEGYLIVAFIAAQIPDIDAKYRKKPNLPKYYRNAYGT
ncbi:hypothetical protein [Lentibacillus cibarius]|uniref:Uncharacterized protein n=1 Tax=Lentibacillus cibarius TaxID=2583219 RepID=A0A5S3QL55_9BACI|nr:hypothetical protein [Lentibacillus cibarius]TMN22674.1 hypothetical protein FFL34_11645 [Lentibacillus cibarius]